MVSAQGIEAELRSVATRSEAIGAESPTPRSGVAPKKRNGIASIMKNAYYTDDSSAFLVLDCSQ
jgi:hypothetical protein